ncbi:hypothetical protein [Mesonia sp. HuA40]|uniref:hypothetical protein n=1 Tax=Mesonia sp. HuA40 TaxID=2602761 RepID=UPI0011C71E1D|nr:hypothetical protein [Mesonia sp. HuA40]TXK75201.1 hypothetical protein FT993_00280 [Mesonia sp. HuA40]
MLAQETYPAVYYYYIEEKEAEIRFYRVEHKVYAWLSSENPFSFKGQGLNPFKERVQENHITQGTSLDQIRITFTPLAVYDNYILKVKNPNLSIDVSNYASGIYVVIPYCDGEIIASKNLVIQ